LQARLSGTSTEPPASVLSTRPGPRNRSQCVRWRKLPGIRRGLCTAREGVIVEETATGPPGFVAALGSASCNSSAPSSLAVVPRPSQQAVKCDRCLAWLSVVRRRNDLRVVRRFRSPARISETITGPHVNGVL
jgi:hypothetical protein